MPAGVEIDFREGDCERLPFDDAAFDVVVSQFGHIFAPRPDVATAEMLRVLKRGRSPFRPGRRSCSSVASSGPIRFDRDTMIVPSLSPGHSPELTERTAGPFIRLVDTLRTTAPDKLDALRREYDAVAAEYFIDNTMRPRATKIR
jgi:ubiquinone/menaquinone biosynthesis C-methylase UbiE